MRAEDLNAMRNARRRSHPESHFLLVRLVAVIFATIAFACGGRSALAQVAPPPGSVPVPIAPPSPIAAPATPVPQASAPAGSEGGAPGAPSPTPAAPTGRRLDAFHVVADRITFYSNRFIMAADGHVTITLGDGTRITGKTFFYDLRLNRFVIAGGVYVHAAGSIIAGAAFSEYFDFDRAYFVPVLSEPDRWTFTNGNYAHPLWGRQMPGDTFFLPDLSGERVFLYSHSAVVDPHQSIRFAPAKINFGFVFVPFPSYFLTYSTNEYFAQNALTGAFADGPLDFAGGEHGLATAHIRYDSVDKVFPAVEVHQVSDDHYFVASVNPLTRPQKVYNFEAYDRINSTLQFQGAFQESAFQHDFSTPLAATAFEDLQLTQALPHSYLQLSDLQYYESLLAQPSTFLIGPGGTKVYYYGTGQHNWIPDHPSNANLEWVGFRHPILGLPINFQLRSSVGVIQNGITALETLGGVPYHTLFDKAVGINLTTRAIDIVPDPTGRHRDLYFTATADKQRQWFDIPRHLDTTIVSMSLTKVIDTKLTILGTYQNVNTSDFFGKFQSEAYPSNQSYYNFYTGQNLSISPGFRGFGTTRSFIQQIDFAPSNAVVAVATMRENDDFPKPNAGGIQLLGDTVGFVNYGVSPYELDLDVRFRFNRVLVLDISRSSYFNFGGFERYSPQFSFQIEK
jgi:hypothetical protein